ncbi:hypothetical protein GIB67_014867 [Kingdonia uniflora]|uniref:Uncharacterized protein n=1 Tax=Kingdonia uniflora TaxID=39325 RepID=A0A7J7MT83_9MAGN|nr:hypothetical protein GIB67_014867 [Kingdonia uniflora]
MFTQWMKTNSIHVLACSLTYVEFPTKWVWRREEGIWRFKRSQRKIGCIYSAHPTSALGLLNDDNEWNETIEEAIQWSSAQMLRHMFVTILLFCEVKDPKELWNRNWNHDDILKREIENSQNEKFTLSDEQLRDFVLVEIEKLMNKSSRSIMVFPIPYPTMMN